MWENRAAKQGRKLRLKVVVLPALAAAPKPDPVFLFGGGPGEAITTDAGFAAGNPLRRDRDLVFVDQRGTGEPDKLDCQLGGHDDDLQSYLGEMFPVAAVRECEERLAKSHDLTLYTTDLAIDDFDEVRAWLGYGKVNVVGGSYGTRAAQVYLRRHPGSVRTVILDGAVPMDEPLSLSHAEAGQRSLDLLFGWCEKDAACHGKFPEVRQEFQAVMDRLRREPVTVAVKHPKTGQPAEVRVAWNVVADGVRWALYSPGDSARLPLMIHRAAGGDFAPLAQASVNARYGAIQGITMGLFFSVTCAEDIPFIDPAEVPARTANTFLGDYRVKQQTAACGVWPRAKIAPAHRDPVRSAAPVLVLNGERDPVTPPSFGSAADPRHDPRRPHRGPLGDPQRRRPLHRQDPAGLRRQGHRRRARPLLREGDQDAGVRAGAAGGEGAVGPGRRPLCQTRREGKGHQTALIRGASGGIGLRARPPLRGRRLRPGAGGA